MPVAPSDLGETPAAHEEPPTPCRVEVEGNRGAPASAPVRSTTARESPSDTVVLGGMRIARTTTTALLDWAFARLSAGHGTWIVTANVDILKRYRDDPAARALYDAADVRVADGMPLVWASRAAGIPLPERVAGSSMTPLVAERAAREGRAVYLLGGAGDAAERARDALVARYPALRIVGLASPWVSLPPTGDELATVLDALADKRPDVVLVALGSPKQEHVARAIRETMPHVLVMGVGISLSFVAGQVKRAPRWMQRAGLEWTHRLAQEPRRLARRYLVDDLPFALELLAESALTRAWRRR